MTVQGLQGEVLGGDVLCEVEVIKRRMVCMRVWGGVEARSCGIVCDSMDCCGGGGAAENVAAVAGGSLFALERELVVTECGFPRLPGLVGRGKAVPVRALLGEADGR